MRCGCPECGAFMVQADGAAIRCVCPDCGYRCTACLGTDSLMSREDVLRMKAGLLSPGLLDALPGDAQGADGLRQPGESTII